MGLAVVFVNTKLLQCRLNLIINYKMKTCLVKQTLNEILKVCEWSNLLLILYKVKLYSKN